MRYFFLFLSLMCFNMQSINAVIMNGYGFGNGNIFIKWEDLTSLSQQTKALSQQVKVLNSEVQTLRTACIAGSFFIVCALIYMRYFNNQENLKVDNKSK
jgi:hypothetical protein